MVITRSINHLICLTLLLGVVACGVKVTEDSALAVTQDLYAFRKKGDFKRELQLYTQDDFRFVTFDAFKSRLHAVITRAGKLKSVKHLHTKTENRNQLKEGLVKYMIVTFEATYTNMTLTESYYFLGSSETPKLVYATLQ